MDFLWGQWGTVYDSVTKRPLDPAYVTLIDKATGKEMSSAITDLDGRYGFLTLPGIYTIVAKKTNYNFPSVKMSGKVFDEVYNDLYFGADITVSMEGEVIAAGVHDKLVTTSPEYAQIYDSQKSTSHYE